MAEKKDERIDDLVPVVERADGDAGFAVNITGEETLGRDFREVSEEDLSKGRGMSVGVAIALGAVMVARSRDRTR